MMSKKNDAPLTESKKAWAGQFKPNKLRGPRLNYNAGIQDAYNKRLQALVSQMTEQVERAIIKWMSGDTAEEFFVEDASVSSQARILTNKLIATFNSLFNKRAKSIAEQMVNQTDKNSKSSLHNSLKELSGGLSLKTSIITPEIAEVSNAAVWENVSLIKSISSEYLSDIQGQVMRSIQQGGNGLADLIPYMKAQKEITQRRARNIALDQTRKAFNSINSLRMQSLGIKKFEWIHSGGGAHPRPLHINLSGKVFSFDDLPYIGTMYGSDIHGIPGQLPNCRCTMAPVIDFDNQNED